MILKHRKMETLTKPPVTFTPSALAEIKRLMSESNFDKDTFLRVGAKGGGCSGLSYVLAFEKKTDKDVIHIIDGIECIINPSHLMYVSDMQIDWQGGLNARGFTFSNPNATDSCGCGSSFAV